ncbi:hypothetical protein BGX33_008919 [Mortierella sp. NVP41]|nr:hypothetical protein BGX33_008919 [Mortierella sp. NVP41]
MILQKSDIFERAPEFKPLGYAIAANWSTAVLFKQMGIWDEFCAMSKRMPRIFVGKETGGHEFTIEDPDGDLFYELLFRQIPREHIHIGCKVTSTKQDDNGVRTSSSNGTVFHRDILVGADGVYSSVRRNLYEDLKKKHRLPLPCSAFSLVGQARPRQYIFEVMLEEKVFETWYYGRTVFIGDACHKLDLAGGAGVANAMHDAISLANYIRALSPHPTSKATSRLSGAYTEERFHWVQVAFDTSKMFRSMGGVDFKVKVVRFIMRNMPMWLLHRNLMRMALNCPQVSFVPLAEDAALIIPAPQPSLNAAARLRVTGEKEGAPIV